MNPLRTDTHRARIHELQTQRRRLQVQIDVLSEEIKRLEDADLLEAHPCACVRRNGEIGVHTMPALYGHRRNILEVGGFVSECYSADLDCPTCGGTGRPR